MVLPDDVNIDCKHQSQCKGVLKCEIAEEDIDNSPVTQEVNEELCDQCLIGKINRELHCQYISGRILVLSGIGDINFEERKIWCELRKRNTTYDYCLKCPYIGTEFTAPIFKRTLEYFEIMGFDSAKKSLEDARERLYKEDKDGSLTSSRSAVESTFKAILTKLNERYSDKDDIFALWKQVKTKFFIGEEFTSANLTQMIGSLSGCIKAFGGLRNELSDSHGKGIISPFVYNSYAELALNFSATICLFVVRRYNEINEKKESS